MGRKDQDEEEGATSVGLRDEKSGLSGQGFGDLVLWLALSLDTPLYNPHGKGPFPWGL